LQSHREFIFFGGGGNSRCDCNRLDAFFDLSSGSVETISPVLEPFLSSDFCHMDLVLKYRGNFRKKLKGRALTRRNRNERPPSMKKLYHGSQVLFHMHRGAF